MKTADRARATLRVTIFGCVTGLLGYVAGRQGDPAWLMVGACVVIVVIRSAQWYKLYRGERE